jgi:hypothetical protein
LFIIEISLKLFYHQSFDLSFSGSYSFRMSHAENAYATLEASCSSGSFPSGTTVSLFAPCGEFFGGTPSFFLSPAFETNGSDERHSKGFIAGESTDTTTFHDGVCVFNTITNGGYEGVDNDSFHGHVHFADENVELFADVDIEGRSCDDTMTVTYASCYEGFVMINISETDEKTFAFGSFSNCHENFFVNGCVTGTSNDHRKVASCENVFSDLSACFRRVITFVRISGV